MAIYYGQLGGVYSFYDSDIGIYPEGSVAVSEELYKKLLYVRGRGAILSTSGDTVTAANYAGTIIDLDNIDESAAYFAPIPLKTQARSALSTARTYVSNNYTMLNETTPDSWVTYLKALMAIANGTDTTSTTLPIQPAATDTGTSSTPTAATSSAATAT